MRTFLFTAILAFLSSGCSSTTSGPDPGRPIAATSTRDTEPAPPIPIDDEEFTPDLAGQARRIMA